MWSRNNNGCVEIASYLRVRTLLRRCKVLHQSSLRSCIPNALPFIVILFGLLRTAAATEFTGPVVSVLDGDTIEVLRNTRPEPPQWHRLP